MNTNENEIGALPQDPETLTAEHDQAAAEFQANELARLQREAEACMPEITNKVKINALLPRLYAIVDAIDNARTCISESDVLTPHGESVVLDGLGAAHVCLRGSIGILLGIREDSPAHQWLAR